ncbi:MAG TPA: transketolase [Candidatus Polarisedimenticolia bacterium]|nr:transketolase [Candidatus Polarisedimenticolia bacterium]
MPTVHDELEQQAINTIRMLAADAVQQANSGHPGMPMGFADAAFVLFTRALRFNPKDPRWVGRDRFVLSGGHGSMLLYAMLHLAGYDVPLDELKRFRQLHAKTAGHPEFGMLPGIEITSGPLGQGLANAVGFALGQAMLSARLGPGNPVEDHHVFVECGDGDLMEGVAYEAASFAGHHRLGRLIALYDDNGITIDGKTDLTFTEEDITERFEGQGWHVQTVDGRDLDGIEKAIATAKGETVRPSLIRVKTTIGFGSPNKAGKSSCHGAALGEEELAATKKNLGWPLEPRFHVPDEVRGLWEGVLAGKQAAYAAAKKREAGWRKENPEKAALLDAHLERYVPEEIAARLLDGAAGAEATRKLNQAVIQKAGPIVPALVSGSADLAESNLSEIKGGGSVAPGKFSGRNIHYGIREHAMGAIANGLAYDGLFIPMSATFLQFADYMRPSVRLAALSKLQSIYVWTHDSVFLGEDGPTHQPIEHLTALRAIPNLHVVRPYDGEETAAALAHALRRREGPTALILSRQKIPAVARTEPFAAADFAKGGYVVRENAAAKLTILATGSEVGLASQAIDLLAQKGVQARLVSIPCLQCFEAQPASYRDAVLPPSHALCAVEAARGTEWWRYVGRDGLVIGIDRFGESAPEKALVELFGFTPAKVAEKIQGWLAARR